MYSTELKVQSIPVRELLEKYCFPEKYIDACRSCPEYGRVWSCPPEVPIAEDYLKGCKTAYIIGVKVIYDKEEKSLALASPQELEKVRTCYIRKGQKRDAGYPA